MQWSNINIKSTGNPNTDMQNFMIELNRRIRLMFSKIDISQILFKINEVEGTLNLSKGGTGSELSAPAADRLLFFDLSENKVDWMIVGDSIKVTDKTISINLGFTAEDISNKDITTTLGTSDTKYPSQKAVKTYVDNGLNNKQNSFTGLGQIITIPDIDGINYHHSTYINGILTAYQKNTTP